jgi:hypothetical protein
MAVEVDGLGTFRLGADGRVDFEAVTRPRVFLAYIEEDYTRVVPIYQALLAAGYDPWLDKRKLLPGQDWPLGIERAISVSDFFMPCFSRRALRKRGMFQREIRVALDCAAQMPLDDVFVVPVRLERCEVPRRIRSQIQYVDLFPDWRTGMESVVQSLYAEISARAGRR